VESDLAEFAHLSRFEHILCKHALGVEFPYVHDITELLTLLEGAGQQIPESVRQAGRLTRFAVFTRYPGVALSISQQEYKEAVALAEEVVRWVEERLRR
jgi:HEPN domain-containing protein